MERSSLSILTSLVLEIGLVVGPFLFLGAINDILYSRIQGAMDPTISLGGWVFVLLVNPLMPILDFVTEFLAEVLLWICFSFIMESEKKQHFLIFCSGISANAVLPHKCC